MSTSCAMKFHSCPHAMQALLDSRVTIAEVTGDLYWGTGLNVPQTEECLQEFWPGKNVIGGILMDLYSMFQEANQLKCRVESPLSSASKTDYGSGTGVVLVMVMVTLVSINANGLHSNTKWQPFWNEIPHTDIICIQEMHLTNIQEFVFGLYA